jgi:hypothetical protein
MRPKKQNLALRGLVPALAQNRESGAPAVIWLQRFKGWATRLTTAQVFATDDEQCIPV